MAEEIRNAEMRSSPASPTKSRSLWPSVLRWIPSSTNHILAAEKCPLFLSRQVVRASSSSIENSIEPVEIPPPWPKKKHSHPYDFKSLDSPNGISLTNQTERSPLPNLLVAKEGTKSTCSCDDKVVYFVVMDVASCILI